MSIRLSHLQQEFLEMVVDYITESKYKNAIYKEWTEAMDELPSTVSFSDPNLGCWELSFRIEWKWNVEGDYDVWVTYRLE